MARPYLSRRQAADRFGIGIKTAIDWVRRFRETGSMASKPMGGCRPKKIIGRHRDWLLKRGRGQTSPCEAWSASWPSVACRSTTGRSGTSFTARSSLIKKDAGRQRA